jgi:hypothetical protein
MGVLFSYPRYVLKGVMSSWKRASTGALRGPRVHRASRVFDPKSRTSSVSQFKKVYTMSFENTPRKMTPLRHPGHNPAAPASSTLPTIPRSQM